jgi:anthranilate phosphoribosyltransferase
VRDGSITPEDLGLTRATRAEITGGDPPMNAGIARRVLDGEPGGARTAVLMNAAAACYVAGLAGSLREGLDVASRSIDGGTARQTLVRFVAKSQLIGAAEATTA